MSTMSERLKRAREEARYDSAAEAAEEMDMPVSTYQAHENGTRPNFYSEVPKYARFFGISETWLAWERGPMRPRHKDPIAEKLDRLPPVKREQVSDFIDYLNTKED